MTTIEFFEKPGCASNRKQKALLRAAGVSIKERNLLTHSWTRSSLRPFFGDRPVPEWFNPSAPTIRSHELDTNALSQQEAIEILVRDPLLIRRPLMQFSGIYWSGFDPAVIEHYTGCHLDEEALDHDLERCSRIGNRPTTKDCESSQER